MPVTHEFMSIMLGTRRPGVTLAVQMLEGAGIIQATRGRIRVRNRIDRLPITQRLPVRPP